MANRLNSSTLSEFVDARTSAMILRIFTAFFMLYGHGFGKLMNVLGGNFQFMDPIGIGPAGSLILAAFAEAICAFLVLIGFWTRLASLILIINMSVAILLYHIPSGDTFGDFEVALMYLVAFVVIFLLGPGKLAVDKSR